VNKGYHTSNTKSQQEIQSLWIAAIDWCGYRRNHESIPS